MKYTVPFLFLLIFSITATAQKTKDCERWLKEAQIAMDAHDTIQARIFYDIGLQGCPDKAQMFYELLLDTYSIGTPEPEEDDDKASEGRHVYQLTEKAKEQIVKILLEVVENYYIPTLQYDAAELLLNKAAGLDVKKNAVARALFEIAFFQNETSRFSKARNTATEIARLLGKSLSPLNEAPILSKFDRLTNFRLQLKSLDPSRFDSLFSQYYPVMHTLPDGEFSMGCDKAYDDCRNDELPQHQVHLSSFQLAETETTFWQLNLFLATIGRKAQDYSPDWGIKGNNPADNLDWYAACEYLNWLSEQLLPNVIVAYNIDSSWIERRQWKVTPKSGAKGFRLPTEAEWEYAARGGPNGQYFKYAGSDTLNLVSWRHYNPNYTRRNTTWEAGSFEPVVFSDDIRFYNLTGNVKEWCWDTYDENYYSNFRTLSADNPQGPERQDGYRVIRGGAWDNFGGECRVVKRDWKFPGDRYADVGFRVAR